MGGSGIAASGDTGSVISGGGVTSRAGTLRSNLGGSGASGEVVEGKSGRWCSKRSRIAWARVAVVE